VVGGTALGEGGVMLDEGGVVGEGEVEVGVEERVVGGLSFFRRMVVVLLGRAMNEEARPFGMGDSASRGGLRTPPSNEPEDPPMGRGFSTYEVETVLA
jgi:hypothetical protein